MAHQDSGQSQKVSIRTSVLLVRYVDSVYKKRKKGPALHFSEGWVEFKSKRIAKYVAAALNNNQIDTRARSKYCDHIWNIKYLSGFKWVHLSERLAYERAVHKQRLRAEVSQAKREASHFQANVERSEKIRRLQRKQKLDEVMVQQGYKVSQRLTDLEIKAKRQPDKSIQRKNVVQSLFGAKS
ncbi:hypothetical protein B566_EDAN009660 [Ephemera danica]|nr:hypothetical protein B566_EDAN009660 [Ephemera danica]